MNQKLQYILDIIQQSEKLDTEQKDKLIKALNDVDKELEITAFKLERTEKVKKTTAILLEETIEELEQKRKAVEQQNRQLEIETALEKVRSAALAMNQPTDMVDVCKIISDQLTLLGVKDIRNVQTAIINEEKGTYLNYQYFTAYQNSVVEETEYNKHPKVLEMVLEMKRSADAFFSGSMVYEELNIFREYRKQDGQFPDPLLDEATEIHYNFYSIGLGGLGLTTYKSLPESALKIFKRFHNVFTLAYRRFIDIENAEAQAREAKIEASLEKVRGVALSLKKSDEMLDIAQVLYEQLLELGFSNIRNAIIDIRNGDGDTFTDYDYSHEMSGTVTHMSYHDDPTLEGQFKKMATTTNDFFELVLEGKELEDLKNMRIKNGEAEDPRLSNVDLLTYNLYSFGNGAIGISNFGVLSEAEKSILYRFSNVFTFAYKRYNDLALAEAQAREAQIELSLERIRAKTMAMQHSSELADASHVLVQQVKALGVNTWGCAFNIFDENQNSSTEWFSNDHGSLPTYKTPREGIFLRYYEACQKGETLHIEKFEGKLCQDHYEYLCTLPVVGDALIKLKESGVPFPSSQIDHVASFKYGYLLFITLEPAPESHEIFKRFAKVFEQTYTRFLDLQKAETQNKIIQAENERKSKELEDARQLQLAMLPHELPKVSNLEIAVYMKTATEVGGDYYDFHIQPDGTLNILIGDATGHGMMSGMMVTIMKSFFIASRNSIELKEFFENSNESIKDMQLGRLMMALMGVQITSTKLIASNAGMPPLLYFRNKSQKAGEFVINHMPLGAMKGLRYSLKEINYEKGDTLLLMSDGFAELKNKNDEQYGYDRVKKEFVSVAQKSSNNIIEHLKASATMWTNGTEPDDDITFVVIKVK